MSISDIEHLPKEITDINGIKDVLLAIDPELVLLREDLTQVLKDLYVKSTERCIGRWEKDFSLPYDASLTLQERRQRVLNKLARKKTLTWQNLRLLIKNNCNSPNFYLSNNSGEYRFRIILQTKEYTQLKDAIDKAKPAYITYDIVVTEMVRRCGTFYCNTEPL